MAGDRGFRTFDHTADIGLASWGPDFAAALAEAGLGLQSLIDRSAIRLGHRARSDGGPRLSPSLAAREQVQRARLRGDAV